MKALRFLRALPLALVLLTPAQAEQSTIVGPTSGPKTMAEVMTTLNAALVAIQTCNSGSAAPANGPSDDPVHFQCWADTTSDPVLYKYYDGASWVTFGALDTSTHVWTPYRNGSPIAAVATSSSAADLTTGTLPAARLPDPTSSSLGGVQSIAATTSQWLDSISTSGIPHASQPAFSDIAGSWACSQAPALTGDISTSAGSCAAAIGAGKVTNSMLAASIAASKLIGTDIATVGTITAGTWNGTPIAVADGGTGATSESTARSSLGLAIGIDVQAWDADLDAFALKTAPTGDVSTSAGSLSTTLATVNSNTGSFGSASAVPTFTVNGKGLITAAGSAAYQDGTDAQKGVVQGDGTTITCVSGVCTSLGGAASSVAVGATTVASGTSGAFLYNNGGTLANASPATKSDQQTGTSTTAVVTPSQQQSHDSAAKAWATWTGSTGALKASYNVSSVTRSSAAGTYTVNFTTAFANTNYSCIAGVSASGQIFTTVETGVQTTGGVAVFTSLSGGAGNDPSGYGTVHCFGSQ